MSTQLASSRRGFLKGGLAAGAALLVGFRFGGIAQAAGPAADAAFKANAFVRIDEAGAVTLVLPKTEMGQGVYTSLAICVADELEVDPAGVRVELPDGSTDAFGKVSQDTGGSTSTRETFTPLRQAGADARAALIAAAAAGWHVPAAECHAEKGVVLHPASKRSAPYAALVRAAAAAPVPEKTPLKMPSAYSAIGRPLRRLDADGKVKGTAVYGIDVVRPGMKIGTLAQSPVFGGALATVDEKAALAVKGVRQVVRLPDAVAVVADHYWAAKKGLDAAAPTWTDGANSKLDLAAILADMAKAAQQPGGIALNTGGLDAAITQTDQARLIGATYEQPYFAHAPMEPANCVVHVRADGCDVWTGTQIPGSALDAAAKAAGLPVEKVAIHNHLMGGGFGRKLEPDIIVRAIQVGKQVDGPVKLVWSREEDIQHDIYRPYYHDRFDVTVDEAGKPQTWHHRITGSSIMARLYPDDYKGVDADAVDGSINTPYTIPAQRVEWVRHESAMPTSWWRGVGGLRSSFVVESFVDELAHAAKQDPVAYRRSLLTDPRAQAVLDTVAKESGWGTPLPKGHGRGVAMIHLWDTYMAQVVEVAMPATGELKVIRVTAAVDCGQPVNPMGIEAQIQGGIVFGLSGALFGEVTLVDGRIEQSNFHDYRVVRMSEAPVIAVHIVPSTQTVGGLGEPPVATVMPALANAVFAATGKRLRTLPIMKQLTT